MQLTPRRHELLSVYLLGAGTLFLYLGYIMQGFISEAVIHAVSERYPGTISMFAGYYGQALHYTAFATSSLITPSIQSYLSSKWILTLASALFAIYYLGFISVNYIYFYISQALMGIGYSFYNNGEGAYLSEHSSRRTLESNTGIETAVGHSR
ncbi:hypothetical protein GCK32_015940 [Trichostrongylus colubriformis]|uniref:Uncharacterized protein n=1 Tax=Trichostrongylus colubriformis TaxID=6319 RepID=A0AAN8ITU0_TRICO